MLKKVDTAIGKRKPKLAKIVADQTKTAKLLCQATEHIERSFKSRRRFRESSSKAMQMGSTFKNFSKFAVGFVFKKVSERYDKSKDHIDNTLPFLDINICRSNGSFLTSVYRKPTFTVLFTNFESFLPITYKKGLIYSLVFRYFNLSSYILFHEELEKLRKFLKLNGYPDQILGHCFKSFLNKIFHPPVKTRTAPKLSLSLVLPYTGIHGFQI